MATTRDPWAMEALRTCVYLSRASRIACGFGANVSTSRESSQSPTCTARNAFRKLLRSTWPWSPSKRRSQQGSVWLLLAAGCGGTTARGSDARHVEATPSGGLRQPGVGAPEDPTVRGARLSRPRSMRPARGAPSPAAGSVPWSPGPASSRSPPETLRPRRTGSRRARPASWNSRSAWAGAFSWSSARIYGARQGGSGPRRQSSPSRSRSRRCSSASTACTCGPRRALSSRWTPARARRSTSARCRLRRGSARSPPSTPGARWLSPISVGRS